MALIKCYECGKKISDAAPACPSCGAPREKLTIHHSCEIGDIEAVKEHLAAGADVNATDEYGQTPLKWAAYEGHKEVVELLIAKGADVNAKDMNGYTPLDFSVGFKHFETSAILRKLGGKSGNLASFENIYYAACYDHVDHVKKHLAAGVDVNAYQGKQAPLHAAAWKGHRATVKLLTDNDADVNAKTKDQFGGTPLHLAAQEGHKEVVELLIAKGADVNAKMKDGITPLETAIFNNHTETANLLRKHGGKTGEELKAEGN